MDMVSFTSSVQIYLQKTKAYENKINKLQKWGVGMTVIQENNENIRIKIKSGYYK